MLSFESKSLGFNPAHEPHCSNVSVRHHALAVVDVTLAGISHSTSRVTLVNSDRILETLQKPELPIIQAELQIFGQQVVSQQAAQEDCS
jgi:hypothetical protein